MKKLHQTLLRLGKQYSCEQIEVRTTHEELCVDVGLNGLKSIMEHGASLDDLLDFMCESDALSLLLRGKAWIELTRETTNSFDFGMQQGWDGVVLTHQFVWTPTSIPSNTVSKAPSLPYVQHNEQSVEEINDFSTVQPLLDAFSIQRVSDKQGSGYEQLNPEFCKRFGVVAPYVSGAMAGGIASVELVQSLAAVGILSFFGAGGLSLKAVEEALEVLSTNAGPWGCNLLHNPVEPEVEEQTVDLLLAHGVQMISASAYMRLSKALVRYRLSGLEMKDGQIQCKHQIFAKASHPSVVQQFLSPAPKKMVQELLADGVITSGQAEMALAIPMSDAITIEADSGGHTDSRPLSVLLPFFVRMRNQMQHTVGYRHTVMIGAAGGIGDPQAINGALSMGADYVLLGSVHQCTVEAGTSDLVKQMLSEMTIIDCALGIAPDMFEIGAHVQVLKKGTMYAQRSQKLYSLYQRYDSIDALPKTERARLEKQVFKQSLEAVWDEAEVYWSRNPSQIERAQRDPKYKMALIFRWYLGNSSRWARLGERSRKMDFQIWCGPSLGCLNQWVKGTDLESWTNRHVVDVVHSLLDGVVAARR